jgi:hypothetical protein
VNVIYILCSFSVIFCNPQKWYHQAYGLVLQRLAAVSKISDVPMMHLIRYVIAL